MLKEGFDNEHLVEYCDDRFSRTKLDFAGTIQ